MDWQMAAWSSRCSAAVPNGQSAEGDTGKGSEPEGAVPIRLPPAVTRQISWPLPEGGDRLIKGSARQMVLPPVGKERRNLSPGKAWRLLAKLDFGRSTLSESVRRPVRRWPPPFALQCAGKEMVMHVIGATMLPIWPIVMFNSQHGLIFGGTRLPDRTTYNSSGIPKIGQCCDGFLGA
uniref:Uncharacterized protein n=1 Tax=Trichuris muris TaxID=70415 RepID=A0A5S6QZC1_TRIMR